jgi:hypothetical protein
MAVCLVLAAVASFLPAVRDGVAGAAIVPPDYPYVNISPAAGYSGPCGSVAQPNPSCPPGLVTLDGDRAVEGVGPMILPDNYSSLTPQEQLFVLTDLERVDRGIPPIEGLAAGLDGLAQAGANGHTNPTFPPYGTNFASSYSSEGSLIVSDILWMYDDGYGGANEACTALGAPGCWLHRQIMLDQYPSPVLMGVGSGPSTTELIVGGDTADTPYFTWSDVVPYLPVGVSAPVISALPGTTRSSSVELWSSGASMTVSVSLSRAAGAGVFNLGTSGCSLQTVGSCSIPVQFTPPSVGVYTTTLAVNGPNGTQDVTLRGVSSHGYHLVASDGGIFSYGDAGFYGSTGGMHLNRPVVAMAGTPDGGGYWLAASDGGIFAYGDAGFHGSMGGKPLNAPIVGLAPTPDGKGYWEVASDGGVFSFGDATFFGSRGGQPLNRPIVGIASSPTGHGYWLVASDGGIFTYGDASFHGSAGSLPLNKPVVGMTPTSNGGGYWLVASDGGVFNYGDAPYFGSMGGQPLNRPILGIAATTDGGGYWLASSDGGVFNYGDPAFFGSMGGSPLNAPIVGAAASA